MRLLPLFLSLAMLAGCGGGSQPSNPPLSSSNLNLVFVVTEDLAHNAPGDMNTSTANLTSRGLQRALRMGSFLQQDVLGGQNVNGIFALEPMTHRQAAGQYPDMVPLETMQQFAALNQIQLSHPNDTPVTANSFPVNVSYPSDDVPDSVAKPFLMCSSSMGLSHSCQGLDFRDPANVNEGLLGNLVKANSSGFYVFAAPWETVTAMMAGINQTKGYGLTLPATLCRTQPCLCDLDCAFGKREPGCLRQQHQPAVELPGAARRRNCAISLLTRHYQYVVPHPDHRRRRRRGGSRGCQ